MGLLDTIILDRIDDAIEAARKALAELEALKRELISRPQVDSSATDALAAELEAARPKAAKP